MSVPICTMRVTTTRIRITVPGIPILTTTGITPGGIAVTTILPGIMVVTTVMATTVVATMIVAVTTPAKSGLEPGDGELPTADAIPDLGTGEGPDWKAIRKEVSPADECMVDKVVNMGAVREAGEMVDTEET